MTKPEAAAPEFYLNLRGINVHERHVDYMGYENCECGWMKRVFRATNDNLVYRILEWCPKCVLDSRFDSTDRRG